MSDTNSNMENENDVLGMEDDNDNCGSTTNGSSNKASISNCGPQSVWCARHILKHPKTPSMV